MPWTASSFASKHNKKLSGAKAAKAASMANAMLSSGTPEGIAIATANKYAKTHGTSTKRRKSPKTVHSLMGA
jgi:uncharacterized protein YdaT